MNKYKKIIRISDGKLFYIFDDLWLCTNKMRIVKQIKDVRSFDSRFRDAGSLF
jgi:hypothetical protein